jgi:hypothetical protein
MAKQPAVVFSHWFHLLEGLQESSKGFYTSLEEAIKKRELPESPVSRTEYREGGIFSAEREYLRVESNELLFDICAAPFGSGFFISWWLGEARPSPLLPTLAALVIACALFYFTGLLVGLIVLVVLFFLLGALMSTGNLKWAGYLLVIPLIGPLFERLFMPPTYYKKDTMLMFQESVHRAALEVIDQITQAKGLRALSESERKPVMSNIFKR